MIKLTPLIGLFFSYFLHSAIEFQNDPNDRISVRTLENELIVKFKKSYQENLNQHEGLMQLQQMSGDVELLMDQNGPLAAVSFPNESVADFVKQELSKRGDVEWVQANQEYLLDPRESLKVSDPFLKKQIHHEIMQNVKSWSIATGNESVVVAITDDGIQLDHKDLKPAIWVNKKEIPNNNIDDDGNGYIDDTVGWDFSDNDNNPTGGRHGTHVAGIVGAASNGIGGVGVAPGVKLMAIRWYGGKNRWTSKIIAKSYAYAVDNGAKIINTSYNIDGFARDKTYLAAVDYVYDKGGIIFNSAGNSGRINTPRQKIEKVVLVASTRSDANKKDEIDKISSFSNYGKGVDIAAPGNPIYATILSSSSNYGNMSGTSMASPNAAGAAALIWSKNPNYTRAQVLKALYAGADNIDKKIGSKYVGQIGAGRVNTLKALGDKSSIGEAPKRKCRFKDLIRKIFNRGGAEGLLASPIQYELTLKGVLDINTLTAPGVMKLVGAGQDGYFNTQDDEIYPVSLANQYVDINQSVSLNFGQVPSGLYAFVINTGQVKDVDGQSLMGNINQDTFVKYLKL